MSVEAGVNFGGASSKTKVGSADAVDSPYSYSTFSIGALPVLNYRISDALSVELSADFLRLGFESRTRKYNEDSGSYKEGDKFKNTDFGLGLNTSPHVFNYTPIKIGLLFKF